MAKMKVATKDRPYVKLECLRVIATLRLNPAKARLISGFVHTYLKLTTEENAIFLREIEALTPEERQPMINVTNEWIEKGRAEGLEKGLEKGREEGREKGREEGREQGAILEARGLLLRLGQKRLGSPADLITTEIDEINETAQLETLCERVLDVETWQELLSAL